MATATPGSGRQTEPSAFLPLEELALLETLRPNVLIAGRPEAVAAVIGALTAGFRLPIVDWHAGAALKVPPVDAAGTLVLHDVARLTEADQHILHEWLLSKGRETQVIATTPQPLLPLVQSGGFDATLYYELNVIYLDMLGPLPRH